MDWIFESLFTSGFLSLCTYCTCIGGAVRLLRKFESEVLMYKKSTPSLVVPSSTLKGLIFFRTCGGHMVSNLRMLDNLPSAYARSFKEAWDLVGYARYLLPRS